MSQTSDLFRQQLTTSADALIWAVAQIPTGRHHVQPLPVFGEWSPLRIVFHLGWDAQHVTLPELRQWRGGPPLDKAALPPEGDASDWRAFHDDMPQAIALFRAARDDQIALLDDFSEADYDAPRATIWGEVPLRWVLAMTFQHTIEHTDTLLKMALYWDAYLAAQKQARIEEGERNARTNDSDSPDADA